MLASGAASISFGRAAAVMGAATLALGAAAWSAETPLDETQPAAVPVPSKPAPRIRPDPASGLDQLSGDLILHLAPAEGESVRDFLLRAGVASDEASRASTALALAGIAQLPAAREIQVALGARGDGQGRPLQGLLLEPVAGLRARLDRHGASFAVKTGTTTVSAAPRRFEGEVGSGLFWALRAAGVPAEAAGEFLEIVSTRVRLSELRPSDRFELVLDHKRAAGGADEPGPLLYVAVRRPSGREIRLVRWTADGSVGWFEPGRSRQKAAGFQMPAEARVSSRFGYRVHPIFRIGRFHSGVDLAARHGTPVHAAADGTVAAAGWNGGYGQQVRLAHGDGLTTSYAHLSRIVARPGSAVRRGELIGFVGSTGFSTGAHLHYEVRRAGRAVDPLSLAHSTTLALDPQELAALNARARQLQSI